MVYLGLSTFSIPYMDPMGMVISPVDISKRLNLQRWANDRCCLALFTKTPDLIRNFQSTRCVKTMFYM